jgi:hypothetical protein
MKSKIVPPSHKTHFDANARLVMTFALALLVLSTAQLAYRFTLPTDGWVVVTQDLEDSNWIYYDNLVGAKSGLQPEDMILSVEGVSLRGSATFAHVAAPNGWRAGSSVKMVVQRNDQQVSLDVPVVHWTGLALIHYNLGVVQPLGNLLSGFIFLFVGWFTFIRRPDLPSARALLLLSTAIGATSISGIIPDGLSVQFNSLAYAMTGFFSYAIFGTLIAPSLLTFTLLFPKPKRIFLRHPRLALLPFGFGLLLLIFFLSGGSGVVGWISAPIMMVASIVSLIHAGLTQRDAVSRAQMRWAISSFVLGIGLFMLNFPLAFNWISNMTVGYVMLFLSSFGIAVIGIGFSVAVLRYRLFDIDVVIRRTLQYTLLTGLLVLVYFGGVLLLQSIFRTITEQDSQVAIVISTLGIAALFNPLRTRIQGFIDRRFYRKKYDAERALASFVRSARDEVELDNLTAALTRVVEETMQPEQVNLWLSKVEQKE